MQIPAFTLCSYYCQTCSNEREGIPVPIIHLLDSCVEIPQYGMVRSLNAHVSGALLVWEYVRQTKFRQKGL